MDLFLPIAVGTSIGGMIGFGAHRLMVGNIRASYRKLIAAKDTRFDALNAEADTLGERCRELRIAGREKDQENEKLAERIRDLEGQAAKCGSNVTPIPNTRSRKRA